MIIFGVDSLSQEPEQNQMVLDLVYTYLNEKTKKKRVDVFLNYKRKKCISIKDVDLGLKLANQHKQTYVLLKGKSGHWKMVNPKTMEIIDDYGGFKQVTREFINNWKPELYLLFNGKIFAP